MAEDIQKLRQERKFSDSKIVDHFLETNGLTKSANPKNIIKENSVKFTRQG